MKSIEDFLSKIERRTHTIKDLSIDQITIHEMMCSERDEILVAYHKLGEVDSTPPIGEVDASKQDLEYAEKAEAKRVENVAKKRQSIACVSILKAIFGYDDEYTDEQVKALQSKYSTAVIDEIFDRVISFSSLDPEAVGKAKKL